MALMNAPSKISVVIPCFNGARYIAPTLRSVLSQEAVEVEVIVVDDGSTDGSADLVRSQFPNVLVLHQANSGVSAARNLGTLRARHEWVAFVDADDIWLPGKLKAQWALHLANPDARMLYTAWHVWTSDTGEPDAELLGELRAQSDNQRRWDGPSGWIYPELLLDCHVWTSTVLARRDLLLELSGFNPRMTIGEDYDLWLRASRLTPILRVSQPLALYRMHPGNVTKRVPSANHKGAVVAHALSQWGYASPDGRLAPRRAVARGLARSWSDYGSAHLLAGELRVARTAALRAIRIAPSQVHGWTVLAKALVRTAVPGSTHD